MRWLAVACALLAIALDRNRCEAQHPQEAST